MKNFIAENFLLETEIAQQLYHDFAKDLPIIDFHNHLPPNEIANNRSFENITKLWLEGDHYKWRAMRGLGIAENKWLAAVLIGIGAAGHQAWSANIFTLVSDVFPKKATASVVGLGGMAGAVAGIISNVILGNFLDQANNTAYFWAFLVAGFSYLIILGFVHLLMPKMTPLDENLNPIKL